MSTPTGTKSSKKGQSRDGKERKTPGTSGATPGRRSGRARADRWVSVKTPDLHAAEQVHLDRGGRIVVPARFRRALGLEPGDPVTVTLEDGVLRVRTVQASLERARALMRKKNPKKASVVDELIAERRSEAAKE